MAKLNGITVIGEVISKDGQQYAASTEQVVKGDIVRVNESTSGRPTIGAYYEVDSVDYASDAQITVEDGERFDTCGDDLTVYKPLKTPVAAQPQFTEVKRKAHVGETIKIVNCDDTRYNNGDQFTVNGVDSDGDAHVTYSKGNSAMVGLREYTVLEPVVAAIVPRPYQSGDVVKTYNDDYMTLTERYPEKDGSRLGLAWRYKEKGSDWIGENQLVGLVTAGPVSSEVVPSPYHIVGSTVYAKAARKAIEGELIVITKTDYETDRFFNVGDIGKVIGAGGGRAEIRVGFSGQGNSFVRDDGNWSVGPINGNSEYVVLTPVADAIVHDGKTYRKTTKTPDVDDLVVITGNTSSHNFKTGEVVRVNSIRKNEIKAYYLDGHDYWFARFADFTVLEPLESLTTATPLKTPAPAVLPVDKRSQFAIGDKVTLISGGGMSPLSGFTNGEVYTVVDPVTTAWDGGKIKIRRQSGNNGYATPEQLALVKSARLTVGDYAQIIAKTNSHEYEVGSFVKITQDDKDSTPYKAQKTNGRVGNWLKERDIKPATKAEFDAAVEALKPKRTPQLPVGSFAKIVGDGKNRGYFNPHGFKLGAIVEVTDIYRTQTDRVSAKLAGSDGRGNNAWSVHNDDLVAAEKPITRLVVGSYVKVVDDKSRSGIKRSEVTLNEIRKIIRDDHDSVPFYAETLDGSCSNHFRESGLIAATEAEVTAARAELTKATELAAEAAKWSAIGRKVGEFKNGDIVKAVSDGWGIDAGAIGVVTGADGSSSPKITVNGTSAYKIVKLITPVESVFSAKAA